MEKGTRDVKCPNCAPELTIITIKITAEMYNKRVRIKCEKCTTTFITEPIPVPAPAGFQFDDLFGEWWKPGK